MWFAGWKDQQLQLGVAVAKITNLQNLGVYETGLKWNTFLCNLFWSFLKFFPATVYSFFYCPCQVSHRRSGKLRDIPSPDWFPPQITKGVVHYCGHSVLLQPLASQLWDDHAVSRLTKFIFMQHQGTMWYHIHVWCHLNGISAIGKTISVLQWHQFTQYRFRQVGKTYTVLRAAPITTITWYDSTIPRVLRTRAHTSSWRISVDRNSFYLKSIITRNIVPIVYLFFQIELCMVGAYLIHCKLFAFKHVLLLIDL